MTHSSPENAVTVTIIAQGDNENSPAEAVHHGLEYARKAGFIEAWSDPVAPAPENAEALELADQIEQSTGLIRMVPGEGTVQLGIRKTALVIAALRSGIRAQCVPSVVEVASAIHDARFGPDYPEDMRNSFDTECASGRAYCIRIARAMLDGFQLAHTSSSSSPGCKS